MKLMTKEEEEEFINKILENIKSNPPSEKDISELKKSIFDANQKYADNTSDFEHKVNSNPLL